MIEGTSDEKLKLLREDLQRAHAEQEIQRALRKAELDAEKQARDEAARGRHDDMMGQLKAMRELLREQRESQTQQVEQMERRHADQVHQHETTLRQMSDIQAAVAALRDEQRAHSEQFAEERAGEKAGGYLVVFCQTSNFESDDIRIQDVQAVKQVFEGVVEAREGLRSMADGMTFVGPLILNGSNLTSDIIRVRIELLEDSIRRHEEIRHILLANASARESVSLSDPS
jgi:hypothetical protein